MDWLTRWWGWALLGLGLALVASKEWGLRRRSSDAPEPVTCAQVVERAGRGGTHLAVADALLCTDALVYRERNGDWRSVLVPAVPRDGAYARSVAAFRALHANEPGARPPPPKAADIAFLARLHDVDSHADAERVAAASPLVGFLVNEADPLGLAERSLVRKSFPDLDAEAEPLLDVGRAPPATWRILAYGGGSLVALLVAGVFWRARRREKLAAREAKRAAERAARDHADETGA